MFIKKALVLLGLLGLLLPTQTASEEPLQLPPEIAIHLLSDVKIYARKPYYSPIYLCQDEAVAREILHSWWEYGELTRDFLMYFASVSGGEKIPYLVDCMYFEGEVIPIRNLGNWPNLPQSTVDHQGFVSITLIEVELIVNFDETPTKFYGFLPDDAIASR